MSVNTSKTPLYLPIPLSYIAGPQKEIETLHNLAFAALKRDRLEDARQIIDKMHLLSEKVHREIPATSKKTNQWSMSISQIARLGKSDPIVNGNDLLQDVEVRLDSIENFYFSSLPSPRTTITIPSSPTQAIQCATGFKNLSNNCWANALLSMIVELPELRKIYTIVAQHHAKDAGESLLSALEAYDAALETEQPVPTQVSQKVREAFHQLFGQQNAPNGAIIFSKDKSAQEDAHEALQVLMSEYDRIMCEKSSPLSPLYTPLQTKRHYAPIAGTEQESTNKNGSQLGPDHTSAQTNQDYQILIDLQGKTHLSFQELLGDFFKNSNVANSDPSTYQLSNGKKQQFQLLCESRQFEQTPRAFMLVIKRFGADAYGKRFKITDPVMVQQILVLPSHATKKGCPIAYALNAFIVHSGGSGGGHYICYKKIQGKWIEVNDGDVRFVPEDELNGILCGRKSSKFTSYLHHYTLIPESEQTAAIRAATSLQNLPPQQSLPSSSNGKSVIQTIQSFFDIVQNGNHTALWIEQLPISVIETLRHAIWLHDATPNEPHYGTKQIEKNPKRLQEIKLPWLIGKKGMSLLDQMIAILEKKEAIAAEKRPEIVEKLQLAYEKEQLEALLELLREKTLTNPQLVKAFERMEIRDELRKNIYLSISIMQGGELTAQQGINAFEQNPRCAVETLEQVVASLEKECVVS